MKEYKITLFNGKGKKLAESLTVEFGGTNRREL